MHQQNQLIQAQHILERRRRKRRRRRVLRNIWVRDWIARRPQLGLYDRLMVELRNEDPRACTRFMRMPPAMHDEIVQRLTPALIMQSTNWRAPLEPDLKVDCRSSGSANVKTSRVRPLYAALQTTPSGVYPWWDSAMAVERQFYVRDQLVFGSATDAMRPQFAVVTWRGFFPRWNTCKLIFSLTRCWTWLPVLRQCFSSGAAADGHTTYNHVQSTASHKIDQ